MVLFAFALLISFEQGLHFIFFIEFHSFCSLHWPVAVDFLSLFGGHSPHQIGQHFVFHCPGRRTKCNGCSPIKVKENFTPPSSFQRFQICLNIVFLHLIFVNCIIRYTLEFPCFTSYSIIPYN